MVEHGQVDPAVVGAVARWPRRPCGCRRAGGRSRSAATGRRVGSKRSGRSTSPSRPVSVAHSSRVASSRFILRSASVHVLGNDPENWATPSRSRPEPADDPDPGVPQRVEVDRTPLRGADQLGRGEVADADEVVDLVVPLVEDAGAVGPPEDVAAAVGPRHPHVLADGQRDVRDRCGWISSASWTPGRRRPDDEHAAVGQVVGSAIRLRGHRRDRRRAARRRPGERRRCAHPPLATTTVAHAQDPVVGDDLVAVGGARLSARHRGAALHRGRDRAGVVGDAASVTSLHRHVPVGVVADVDAARGGGRASSASAAGASPTARCATSWPPRRARARRGRSSAR